jgi:hypothetical protein
MKHRNFFKLFVPFLILVGLILVSSGPAFSWGFYSHRLINRHAVFCLPSGMVGFYKKHIEYLTEHSIDPDKISRVDPDEAPRHYIDMEHFGDPDEIPLYWKQAVQKYGEDSLKSFGVLPWHISTMLFRLTEAFKDQDPFRIILLSARLGHYVADATMPLHTTRYYNGRTPEQRGIHAFWETRIPELYASQFEFFVGRAAYIENGQIKAWELIRATHAQVDTVYMVYDGLMKTFKADRIYLYDTRGTVTKRNYSREFAEAFEKQSDRMIERNMKLAVLSVASFWYTAWVNAGQPDLDKLLDKTMVKQMQKEKQEIDNMWKTGKTKYRPNPEDEESSSE